MSPSLYAEALTWFDWSPRRPVRESRIIGLHGFAQSGKDTVAGFLKHYGYEQVVLAKPLLDCLVALDPIVAADANGRTYRFAEVLEAEGYEEAKKTPEFRRLLQVFGSEVGRDLLGPALGVNTWVDIARNKIAKKGQYVISDVRFRDEVKMVREEGGLLVKVKRPGYGPINGHKSDAGLPDHLFDVVIYNDGTLTDLAAKVEKELVS